MGIKSKNIKYSMFGKAIAFILAVALLTGIVSAIKYLDSNTTGHYETILNKDYYSSKDFDFRFYNIKSDLITLIKYYKSEEYIKSGGTVNNNVSLEDGYDDYGKKNYAYSWELRSRYDDFKYNYIKKYKDDISEKDIASEFEKKYSDLINEQRNKYINKELNKYNNLIKRINSITGLYYYVSSEDNEYSNTQEKSKAFFKTNPVYMIFDKNGYEYSNVKTYFDIDEKLSYYPQDIVFIALSDEYVNPLINQWNYDRYIQNQVFYTISLLALGFILCIIYLIYSAGRVPQDDDIHLLAIDRIYIDINIILAVSIIVGCTHLAFDTFESFSYKYYVPLIAFASVFAINLILTIAKHIKHKTILTHNILYKLIFVLCIIFSNLAKSFPISLRMFPTPKKAADLENILDGVEQIKNGKFDYRIKAKSKGIYFKLSEEINNISDGIKAAVQNELKSERLKTELITNVSHDIRTPLTSIITYIDILKKEGINSKNAEKYLNILDQKALRLKTLTDDLFEVSKASSGNIPVNIEKVDITALINQVMGELNKKISSSGLDFKYKYPKEKLYIQGDGKLLWRVIENLMSNIFKYALNKSRVYIDVIDMDDCASIVFKNISAYELNINSEELMERFKRGDESRSSEGSGLGLSIAKELVAIQNGQFDVKIDGDLFKATIILPKYDINNTSIKK